MIKGNKAAPVPPSANAAPVAVAPAQPARTIAPEPEELAPQALALHQPKLDVPAAPAGETPVAAEPIPAEPAIADPVTATPAAKLSPSKQLNNLLENDIEAKLLKLMQGTGSRSAIPASKVEQ